MPKCDRKTSDEFVANYLGRALELQGIARCKHSDSFAGSNGSDKVYEGGLISFLSCYPHFVLYPSGLWILLYLLCPTVMLTAQAINHPAVFAPVPIRDVPLAWMRSGTNDRHANLALRCHGP